MTPSATVAESKLSIAPRMAMVMAGETRLLIVSQFLVTAGAVQSHLFDPVDRTRQRRLLEAIDQINRKNGTDTVRVASQGSLSNFGLRTAFVSRRFTTNLDEVIQVKTDFNISSDNTDPLCN